MPYPLARLALAVLLCLPLSACVEKQRRSATLDNTLRKYEVTIRWGSPDDAYFFQRFDEDAPPQPPRELDNIRVTGYEVLRPPGTPEDDRVSQTVRIRYLFKDRQVVRSLLDRQEWEYDREDRRWYLVSPVPEFR